jgi:hypothetical protein
LDEVLICKGLSRRITDRANGLFGSLKMSMIHSYTGATMRASPDKESQRYVHANALSNSFAWQGSSASWMAGPRGRDEMQPWLGVVQSRLARKPKTETLD